VLVKAKKIHLEVVNMKDDTSNNIPKPELDFEDLDNADKALVEKTVSGGYSRRSALKIMAATGVTLATAENLLSSGGTAMAATPKKGGTIRFSASQHGPDDNMDPALFTSSIDYARGRAHYNSLIQLDGNLVPQPELAESFEPNSNATEWTFKLRKDVNFHDGTPLTVDDVLWSMNRHLSEDSTSVVKAIFSSVKEWKKTGSHEIKAIMNSPNADLAALLGIHQMKIIRNGTAGNRVKEDGTIEHNGTGPFVMDYFSPGEKSISTRNKNYWREGANLDSLQITAITDPIARVNALVAGDVQLIMDVDPKAIRQIENADGVHLNSTPSGAYNGICAMQNAAPGNNPDFVKGLKFIQDRERFVKRIMKGHGSIGNDQPIMSAYGPDWCSELPQRQFDPDKAKFHFKKSGISTAELYVAPVGPGIEDVCLLVQANCAKIGFDLKLKKVPTDGYWGAVWMKEPLNVTSWNMRPTANSMLAIAFAPDAAWNDTLWSNARMGELLTLSLAEIDPDKRHAMFCEMQTLVNEECGMIIPMHVNLLDGLSDRVQGIPDNPISNLGGMDFPEFCWLA
jgi:peptide/nickel transport system substrate-binding protein